MDINMDKFWDEIIQQTQAENLPPQPNEISVKEFAERIGWATSVAYNFLETGVEQGKWKKRQIKINGHKTSYYSPHE